jgi:hypothetical protein
MSTDSEVSAPQPLDDDKRLRMQAICRERLDQLSDPFVVSSPAFAWLETPTPVDSEHGRWEPADRYEQEMPSLIDQLRTASTWRVGATGAKGTWESRPTAALEAIDAVKQIGAEVEEFVRTTLHAVPTSVDADLRHIARRVSTLVDEDLQLLVRLVRSWWTSAQLLSGITEPPLTPHVRCPLCNEQDSIRARPDAAGDAIAMARCRKCGGTWDESTIGLLSAAISDAPKRPRRPPAPKVEWVYLGNASEAKRWAINTGIDPSVVYPASLGPDKLVGLRGPVNLVQPAVREELADDAMAGMRAVVDLVRDVNVRVGGEW